MRTSHALPSAARRLTALCLAGATAFALAACGSDGGAGQSGGSAASEVTQANFAETITASQESMTSAHMEMTYSGAAFEAIGMAGSTIVADVNYASKTPEMRMSMSIQGMDVDMIFVGGDIYIGMGDLTQGKYLHLTEEELLADPTFSGMTDSLQADVAEQAKAFHVGITSFEETGTEIVDGTDVTVYTMTVDPSKIAADAAGMDAEAMSQVDDMEVVYRLDANNVPRSVDMVMNVAGQEMTMSTVLSKINEPVTITAPSAEETIPYSEMAG